jgi:hypothetical protein
MALTAEQIDNAFREVLGRSAGSEGVKSHLNVKDEKELRKILRRSEEGMKRASSGGGLTQAEQQRLKRLKPNSNAAKALREKQEFSQNIDPKDISEKYQPYVAAWQSKNRGKALTVGTYEKEIKYWHNLSNENVEGYKAYLDGDIIEKSQGKRHGENVYIVSDRAVNRMGGKVDLRVTTTGQVFVTPENAEWTTNQKRRKTAKEAGKGMSVYYGIDKETGGLLGSLGIKELDKVVYDFIPKELMAASDPLNISSSYIGGSKMTTRNRETLIDDLGIKPDELAMVEAVGRTVATVVVGTVTGGVGSALMAGTIAGASAAERGEWGAAAADFATAAISNMYAPSTISGATQFDAATRGVSLAALNLGKDAALGRGVTAETAAAALVAAGAAPYVPEGRSRDFNAVAAAAKTAAAGGSRGEIGVAALAGGAFDNQTYGQLAANVYGYMRDKMEGPPQQDGTKDNATQPRPSFQPPPVYYQQDVGGQGAERTAGESYI